VPVLTFISQTLWKSLFGKVPPITPFHNAPPSCDSHLASARAFPLPTPPAGCGRPRKARHQRGRVRWRVSHASGAQLDRPRRYMIERMRDQPLHIRARRPRCVAARAVILPITASSSTTPPFPSVPHLPLQELHFNLSLIFRLSSQVPSTAPRTLLASSRAPCSPQTFLIL
jgi:hypothetical protein